MDEIERKREVRLQKAYERLGTTTPCCVNCTETYPHCLELHHLAEFGFSDETVIVCRNCHRKLTDKQKDHPPTGSEPGSTETIGRFLLGITDLFELLIRKLREFGHFLIAGENGKPSAGAA
jgi:hypothetical protein